VCAKFNTYKNTTPEFIYLKNNLNYNLKSEIIKKKLNLEMKNKKSRIRNKFQIQNHKWTRKINLKGKHHKEIRNTCYIFTN